MERDIYHYIAWRRASAYLYYSSLTGGANINSDDRLWNTEGCPFVLSIFENGTSCNYAVADADAEELIDRIRECCKDKPPSRIMPYRELGPNGPEAVAVVQIGQDYLSFDDAGLLRKWLDDLKMKCGTPLNDAEFYHYTHPAPVPVEGEVRVVNIVEQAVIPPQNPTLAVAPPDTCRSELLVEEDIAILSVYRDGMHLEYILPDKLLSRVNKAAEEMLSHPADGYHQNWDADAWIRVDGRDEEFHVEPEEVLKLFEELVSGCGDPLPCIGEQKYYRVSPEAIRRKLENAWYCHLCDREENTGKYCQICGASFDDIVTGNGRSEPKERADAPWRCRNCKTEGNVGQYCCNCRMPYSRPLVPVSSDIGYRKGKMTGMRGGFFIPAGIFSAGTAPKPVTTDTFPNPGPWICSCGSNNISRFCPNCGKPRPGR